MPRDAASAPQLPLFVSESSVAQEVLTRDEAIRPVLTGQRSLPQQRQPTGLNYGRLWRDLQRFQRRGLLGLVDRRTLPHARGKPTVYWRQGFQAPVERETTAVKGQKARLVSLFQK